MRDDQSESGESASKHSEESERLAQAAKLSENIKKASVTAQQVLGKPLDYDVVKPCILYEEPSLNSKIIEGALLAGVV